MGIPEHFLLISLYFVYQKANSVGCRAQDGRQFKGLLPRRKRRRGR